MLLANKRNHIGEKSVEVKLGGDKTSIKTNILEPKR